MKVLYIGESWLGSCARSLREALVRSPGVEMDDINEDAWFTKPHSRWLRAINRVTKPVYQREFDAAILQRTRELCPAAVVVYKGSHVALGLIQAIRREGVRTINVYPDCSPHHQGETVKRALGGYDLVVSTKVYHPQHWATTYGYHNPCIFVPQGYDPILHLRSSAPTNPRFDVILVATWRFEYGRLMRELAKYLADASVTVAIGGHGWAREWSNLPAHWVYLGARAGQAYVEALRTARICIAPLTRKVTVEGMSQLGDVDTTRTYELAAAHCFFIHRRTDYAKTLYNEATEVPMFDSGDELARHVRYYLAHPEERAAMAAAAHRRAVPAYSMDERATEIIDAIRGSA